MTDNNNGERAFLTDAEQVALATDDGRPQGDRWKQPALLEFARISHARSDFFDFVASTFYSQKCALCRTVQGIALVLSGPLMFWAAHGFLAGAAVAAFWLVFWLTFRAAVYAVDERERRGKAATKASGGAMKDAILDAMSMAREEAARAKLATLEADNAAREMLRPPPPAPAPIHRSGPADGELHPVTGQQSTGAPGGAPAGSPDAGVESGDDLGGLPAAAMTEPPARRTTQTTATVTVVGNAPAEQHRPRPQERHTWIEKHGQGPTVTLTTAEPGQNNGDQ